MPIFLTDGEIADKVNEIKPLQKDFSKLFQPKQKNGHREFNLNIDGGNGSQFRLVFRQSIFNSLDFSVILLYLPVGTNRHFRIRRYNGKSHEHTNKLENETFYDFHIHQATERYQAAGWDEDDYAQPTQRYSDHHGALTCMLNDCGFEIAGVKQSLSGWGLF